MILKIFLTLLPSLLWFYYLLRMNKDLLINLKLYLYALLMVVPALLIEKISINLFNLANNLLSTIILSFIIIALVEEIAKYLALRQGLNYVNLNNLNIKQGVIFGVTVGFAFAQGENILYALFFAYETILLRILITPFLHAIFSGIVGVFFFKAIKQKEEKILYQGLLIAIFLHGIYDFLLLS